MIKSPYNFVPLSKYVFFPEWDDKISHDIPFSDGESGEIDITIKAETPIYVRNGSKNKDEIDFSHYIDENGEKKYFIPGTSIKGMIRNVLEIMSFGKFNKFNNDRYSVRDLNNKQLYRDRMNLEKIRCGWLDINDEENITIEDCGLPLKISYKEIDKQLGTNFFETFKKKNGNTLKNSEKTAKYKYKTLLKKIKNTITYKEKTGILVCTGQPSLIKEELIDQKNKNPGKYHDFIFPNDINKIYTVDEEVYKTFKFAYFDGDIEKESKDWAFWKNNKIKIPVFFKVSDNEDKIEHFGLSQLYKLPYKRSVGKSRYDEHKVDNYDLSECVFGTIDNENHLKGRVQFSNCVAKENIKRYKEINTILSSPKASFYPFYIEQKSYNSIVSKYITFMDGNSIISGWKRYPVHSEIKELWKQKIENKKVATQFVPLDKGTVFKGKIRFHNLRKAEIGALISALTFHNTEDVYHSLGMAKPLGFGKVKIKISLKDSNLKEIDYLKEFERELIKKMYEVNQIKIGENWTDNLSELVTMASTQNNNGASTLAYIKLNDFVKIKQQKKYLKRYSELDNIVKKDINPLLTPDEIRNIFNDIDEKKKLEKELEEREKERKLEEEKTEKERIEKEKQLNKKMNYKGPSVHVLLENTYLDFKKIKEFLGSYPKIELDEEKEIVFEAIERSYNSTKNKSNEWKKNKKKTKNKERIKKWIGEELANKLFGKLGI